MERIPEGAVQSDPFPCDVETMVQQEYTPECMQRRNRYMVDHASLLLAASTGESGGTRSTILYAMQQGLDIVDIPIGGHNGG